MGDFGITTSAGALVFGAAVEAPADTFTYTAATLSVAPGTYTLAELALAGYTPAAWTCTNGDGGAFDAGSVTLAAGDPTVTCSITNDDETRRCPAGEFGQAGEGPETDVGSLAQGSTSFGDPHDPWLAVLLTALIAIVATCVVIIGRRLRGRHGA